MARVDPKDGLLLSGRLGDAVYCIRPEGTAYVRKWVKPKDPQTPDQLEQRSRFGAAVEAWRKLPDADKKRYRDRAARMKRTGYHLFVSEYSTDKSPC